MARTIGGKPKCEAHEDCFANKKGQCVCLSENDFGERDCPFYKPRSEVDMKKVHEECKAYAQAHGGRA